MPSVTGPCLYLEGVHQQMLESLYNQEKEQQRIKKEREEMDKKAQQEEIEFYKQYYKDEWHKYYTQQKGIIETDDNNIDTNYDNEICTSKIQLTKEEKRIKDEEEHKRQHEELIEECKKMEARILKENKMKVEKFDKEIQREQIDKQLKEEIGEQEKKKRQQMKEFKEQVEEENRKLMDQYKKKIESKEEKSKEEMNSKIVGKWKKKDERKKQSKKKKQSRENDEGIVEESQDLKLIKQRIQNIHDIAEQKMEQAEEVIDNREFSLRSLIRNAVTLTDRFMSVFNRGDSAENHN